MAEESEPPHLAPNGENVTTEVKIEDQIAIGKRLVLVGSTGALRSQSDVAYGANLEARLNEKDYPIGQDQSTLGLSLMRWRGDLALGANPQSQFAIRWSYKMAVQVGLNNKLKLSGQITVRTSSSEQLQIALMDLLPIANAIFRSIWPAAVMGTEEIQGELDQWFTFKYGLRPVEALPAIFGS